MKSIIYLVFFLVVIPAIAEEAQLGIILGSTSGLSFKNELGNEWGKDRAIDAALSYSIQGKYGLSFHADYLFNRVRQFSFNQLSPVYLYYGLGGRTLNIRNGTDEGASRLGVRGPVGLHYRTSGPDLEFFGEVVPIVDLTPSSEINLDVGLGVRVIF